MIAIVDTHQHLWDLSHLELNWMTAGHPLEYNYTPREYQHATKMLNVTQAVYMEVDVKREFLQREADLIVELCKSATTATRAAVLQGRPADDDFRDYAKQFEGSPYVKGLRQCIHVDATPPGYCLQPKFVAGIQYLGELNLSYDICIRPEELGDAAKLVDACPGTRFILDHCGNARVPDKERLQWMRDMDALGKRKNLVCKVSGIVASAEPGKWTADDLAPIVRHTIGCFGWDRVMFGGDWPVCTLAGSYLDWVTALRSVVGAEPESNQRRLFSENAIGYYGLSKES